MDADWSAWTSATFVCYDVDNGVYTFWVTAKDEAENENQAPLSYSFGVDAAPTVASVVRTNRSVWATQLTFTMPSRSDSSGDNVVVVSPDQHSGIADPDLIPIALHYVGDSIPVGVNEAIADALGLPAIITKAAVGWLVTLPASIPPGESADYDLVWGKFQYFGWQEYVVCPAGFPDGGGGEVAYLKDDLTLWRLRTKRDDHGTGEACDDDAWVFMDAWDGSNHISHVAQTTVRFARGECWGGNTGTTRRYEYPSIWPCGSDVSMSWRDYKYTWDGSTNYYDRTYGLQIVDSTGHTVCWRDGQYYDRARYYAPKHLIHGLIWMVGASYGPQQGDTASAWFSILDPACGEIRSKTFFDQFSTTYWSDIFARPAEPLGDNVLLLWARNWDTSEDYYRGQLYYQVRDQSGDIVVPATPFTPDPLPDPIDEEDEYYYEHILGGCDGQVWASYVHVGPSTEYFYVVFGAAGGIVEGPTQTTSLRGFHVCDSDGYVWATEGGVLHLLASDGSPVAPARTGAFTPNQAVGTLLANVSGSGYRLYDRWSPALFNVDVPMDCVANEMDLFSLNLWDNDLHPANLTLDINGAPVVIAPGPFTEHETLDVTGLLAEGANLCDMTQNDLQGGQVLITFPYTATGACCYLDGTCDETTEADCTGVWHSEWADCSVAECPQPTAACCYADGTCDETTEADCTGVWHSEWANCSMAECPQLGACCAPDGSCSVTLEADCNDDWHWEWADCSVADCLPATGACCYGGGCLEGLEQDFCENDVGGFWEGPDTQCDDPGICVYGACCLPAGDCRVLLEEPCADAGGMFQGPDSVCDPNPCVGACCVPDGECVTEQTESECLALGGVWMGLGSECDPSLCNGACCLDEGTCVSNQSKPGCDSVGGEWGGPLTECSEFACVYGACCIGPDHDVCVSDQSEANCLDVGGQWAGLFTDCDPNPCPLCSVPGDLDGDCDVDLADLAALLGCYGTCAGDEDYNPDADFDDSGCIDLADLAELLGHYGEGG